MNNLTQFNKIGGGRIDYIDFAKGILIILLVFAHFRSALLRLPYENPLFEFVYGWNSIFTCFYMPAFFIASGYCFTIKDKSYFLKSLIRLFIPLLCLGILESTAYEIYLHKENIIYAVFHAIRNLPQTLWFLWAMIWAKCIIYIIIHLVNDYKKLLVITFFLMILGVIFNQYNIVYNLLFFQHAFIAAFWISVGYTLRRHSRFQVHSLRICKWLYPILIIFCILINKVPTFTASISISVKTIPLFLLLSYCGTIFLFYFCKKIRSCSLLTFWGQNSLVVYGLHFTPLLIFTDIYYRFIQPDSVIEFLSYLALIFISEYLVCYLFIKLFQYKYFKWMIGKF